MNLIGKILTMLILVMSLLFLFVAFMVAASHQNWKGIAEENQSLANQYLDEKNQIKQQIVTKEQQLRREQVSRMMVVAQLESQWQRANADYNSIVEQLSNVTADLQQKTITLKEAEERLNEQDGQVAELDGQVTTLTQNIAAEHSKVIELQNLRFQLSGTLEALESQKQALANSMAANTRVMKKFGISNDMLVDDIPPILDGVVTKIRENGLVEINLGTDDGLKKGHTVDIHRRGQYVGQGTVHTVIHNQAAVQMIREMTDTAVLQEDLVTTEWSRPNLKNEN